MFSPDSTGEVLVDRYRLERLIGQGGMASVHLARDIRHDRDVAIKVLRPELSAVLGIDRFLSEIRTTANLQHPHILPLHDSGEVDGTVFYVMPYIDGESLRHRLNRERQLPVDDAIHIAQDIGSALDYAHRHGVVHRDVKPENILLHDKRAIVADFGIALAMSRTDGATRLTETGMSLGTPHYMSPEQAMGEREITARCDIYALACVLYEMLTGEPPFTGPTPQAIIARVITEHPRSVTTQRGTVPPHVEAALLKALQKVPADRFSSAAEFVEALTKPGAPLPIADGTPSSASATRTRITRAVPWIIAASAIVAAVAMAMFFRGQTPDLPTERQFIVLGTTPSPPGLLAVDFEVALDGSAIIYADTIGGPRLWLKERDQLTGVPLAGSDSGMRPVFSPDGKWIAFAANGHLRKIPRAGGAPITLADSVNPVLPAVAWLEDGRILFNDHIFGLRVVNQDGSGLRVYPRPKSERFGVLTLSALPGSRGALVGSCTLSCSESRLRALDMKADSMVTIVENSVRGWYTDDGFLVYARRDGAVFAAPFDVRKLAPTAAATPVLDAVRTLFLFPDAYVTPNGSLYYVTGKRGAGVLLIGTRWVERTGKAVELDTTWRARTWEGYGIDVSPDGKRAGVNVAEGKTNDIWIKQLPAGAFTRVTFDGVSFFPRWSRDGHKLLYASAQNDTTVVIRSRDADGAADERVVATFYGSIRDMTPMRDSQAVLVVTNSKSLDIQLAHAGSDKLTPLIAQPAINESSPALSPDERWISYVSNESGREEVYVRPYPAVNTSRWQISLRGGIEPSWSRDGKELFYRDTESGELIRMQVADSARGFAAVARTVLFSTAAYAFNRENRTYAVGADSKHFLFFQGAPVLDTTGSLVVVNNWTRELRASFGGRSK